MSFVDVLLSLDDTIQRPLRYGPVSLAAEHPYNPSTKPLGIQTRRAYFLVLGLWVAVACVDLAGTAVNLTKGNLPVILNALNGPCVNPPEPCDWAPLHWAGTIPSYRIHGNVQRTPGPETSP